MQCKQFENRLRFDKVTDRLKVGTFLRHSVYTYRVTVTKFLDTVSKLMTAVFRHDVDKLLEMLS